LGPVIQTTTAKYAASVLHLESPFIPADSRNGGSEMRGATLCIIVTLSLSNLLHGQATRPSTEPWTQTVEQFAQALAQSDPAALVALLADNASVQAFDAKTADAVRLLSRTQGAAIISARAYVHAPSRMATDIVESFAQAQQVPDEVKRYMTPRNETQMAKANDAAAKWLTATLAANPGDPVGVVVLWSAPTAALGVVESVRPEIIFVLVKGGMAGGSPRIEAIAFGNPQWQSVASN
jgi:precorrin isomerase